MTTSTQAAPDERARRERQRAVWAMGDYPAVAVATIPRLGARLVEAAGVRAGDRVLDVAAGAGNVAIPAALAGAQVTACDLTPELMDAGRAAARQVGAEVEWREGDAQALPFADAAFDVVLSCVGVMFAPGHQECADELLRVCRPGGTLGLISWTPEGFVGQLLAAMKPFAPAPPAGALPPPLWGREEHVRSLLGERVADVVASRETVTVDCFDRPEDFRDFFRDRYGPVMSVYRAVADEPQRLAALDRNVVELTRRHDRGTATTVMDWEYLLLTAHVRS